jgi:hypothetical protein
MATALYADDPRARLDAGLRTNGRHRKRILKAAAERWPTDSPGAANAWLLMVTTKPPVWRDPFVEWRDHEPTLGEPHENFFYPDPLGFWTEVRHWAGTITGLPGVEAVSVTALLHDQRLDWAVAVMQPQVVLFLDEPAWHAANISATKEIHHIPDPHRNGQVYEGWWGRTDAGLSVGKAPQHPAAHKLYSRDDMDRFLRSWAD